MEIRDIAVGTRASIAGGPTVRVLGVNSKRGPDDAAGQSREYTEVSALREEDGVKVTVTVAPDTTWEPVNG